jgi:cardiolipin synthase A/B
MGFILSCLFLLVTLAGCATLPDVGDIVYGPLDIRTPTVVGPQGELSRERSKRIVERLERQSGSTDLLTRQSIVLEEITGSPLIAGNSVTLLIDGPATYGAMLKAIQDRKSVV